MSEDQFTALILVLQQIRNELRKNNEISLESLKAGFGSCYFPDLTEEVQNEH